MFTVLEASGHLAYDALCFVSLVFDLPLRKKIFALGPELAFGLSARKRGVLFYYGRTAVFF